ncbi:M14 family metallopeptidase [Flavobacterium rhizosphaerae]|uniref:M14 family metallopeptidase n=1 Tax=Flavobacterium rhizosphaerae TaxID=3163298 RepID=A0ABW8YRN3_9FLAO
MRKFLLLLLLPVLLHGQKKLLYKTPFEKGNGNQAATYSETITFCQKLDKDFETVQLKQMGQTDSGEPLHIIIYNPEKEFDFSKLRQSKSILLINNGIHPGEPDGIDASMMLFRDLATGKITPPKNTVIVAIPVYNIGGALNRNSHSRANQNGPESYGFRGNARNYDLNRDFVKCDTKNARSFTEIFHTIKPDIFIDNHVSNGADYQYTFTYVATQHQKLGGSLGNYYKNEMQPAILAIMKAKGIDATPYVNIHDEKPDNGFTQFMDYPRFSTGYASMFDVPGTMPETHMLKPYADRVAVTYTYMAETIAYMDAHSTTIKNIRAANRDAFVPGNEYTLQWKTDSARVTLLPFKGYEAGYKKSGVSAAPRLYYDRARPFEKIIKYYQEYQPTVQVKIPEAYIVPKAWWNIAELLKLNNIEMYELKKDTVIEVQSYHIENFETVDYPYEGHYMHYNTQVVAATQKITFHKGDYIVSTRQPGVKYLMETLEPQGSDSFFNWNFFDSILQQKEYFSAYVFEDTAVQLLRDNPELKKQFEIEKQQNKTLATNPDAQLDWIYTHSDYYEKAHRQYPVYRKIK